MNVETAQPRQIEYDARKNQAVRNDHQHVWPPRNQLGSLGVALQRLRLRDGDSV
jgi:hypothetical protein